MSEITVTLPAGKLVLNYSLLGTEKGGFHPRYTDTRVAETNLQALRQTFGTAPSTMMLAKGGSEVRVAEGGYGEVTCDALISTVAGHALILRPADCIPVLLYSADAPVLALVHGSRTSLESDVLARTIQVLGEHGISPRGLLAHAAPGITAVSYVLPNGIKDSLKHQSWRRHISDSDMGVTVDLFGFIKEELHRLGIPKRSISANEYDTARDSRYYSHYNATRHGAVNGRNGFICVLTARDAATNI